MTEMCRLHLPTLLVNSPAHEPARQVWFAEPTQPAVNSNCRPVQRAIVCVMQGSLQLFCQFLLLYCLNEDKIDDWGSDYRQGDLPIHGKNAACILLSNRPLRPKLRHFITKQSAALLR